MDYNVKEINVAGFDVIFSALTAFKNVRGHLKVHREFVVPQNDSAYPEKSWGMKLGYTVNCIRNNGYYAERRDQLEALGLDYNVKKIKNVSFDVIYSALVSFKNVHSHLNVDRKFVVPKNDVAYPEETWGMKLGFWVRNIQVNGTTAQNREQLEALGFPFKKHNNKSTAAAVVEVD